MNPPWIVRRVWPGRWTYGPVAYGTYADPVTKRRWLNATTFEEAVQDADRRARTQCPPPSK